MRFNLTTYFVHLASFLLRRRPLYSTGKEKSRNRLRYISFQLLQSFESPLSDYRLNSNGKLDKAPSHYYLRQHSSRIRLVTSRTLPHRYFPPASTFSVASIYSCSCSRTDPEFFNSAILLSAVLPCAGFTCAAAFSCSVLYFIFVALLPTQLTILSQSHESAAFHETTPALSGLPLTLSTEPMYRH